MTRKTYMIVTEIGYFISSDTLKADIDEAIRYFKEKYNFSKVIDVIEEPYSHDDKDKLDELYETSQISDEDYDKECDKFFDKIIDINRNMVASVVMDGQM